MQTEMAVGADATVAAQPWPKDAPAQFIALRSALARGPASAQDIARRFTGVPRGGRVAEILATLAALGQVQPLGGGRYVA